MSMLFRVSLSSVTNFQNSVEKISSFSQKISGGKASIEELYNQLSLMRDTADNSVTILKKAKCTIQNKIKDIRRILSELYSKRDELINRINEVESQMASTPIYITKYDTDGNPYEIKNYAYTILENKLSSLENFLSLTKHKIEIQEERLYKAERFEREISDTMRSLEHCINALVQNRDQCKKLFQETDEIASLNHRKSDYAYDKLSEIIMAIEAYNSAKMIFDNSIAYNRQSNLTINNIINTGFNVTVNNIKNEIKNESIIIDKTDKNVDGKISEDHLTNQTNYNSVSEEIRAEKIATENIYIDESHVVNSINASINLIINNKETERQESIIDIESKDITTIEKEYADDNGVVYRIGNDLIKNNQYEINGYSYETDENGRIKHASGKLYLAGSHNRIMNDLIGTIGKGDELDTDDRGHIIGHQFNGSGGMENLVPQDMNINRGDYKALEYSLAKEVDVGKNVSVSIIPYYQNESRRPEMFLFFYTIDGVSHNVMFPNKIIEE